jgi:malate/lactate dehydrogenase
MEHTKLAGRVPRLGINADIIREVAPKQCGRTDGRHPHHTQPTRTLAATARRIAGHDRVINSDIDIVTLRSRFYIAKHICMHPTEVDASVICEQGNSRILLWSNTQIANTHCMSRPLSSQQLSPTFRA